MFTSVISGAPYHEGVISYPHRGLEGSAYRPAQYSASAATVSSVCTQKTGLRTKDSLPAVQPSIEHPAFYSTLRKSSNILVVAHMRL